MTRASKVIALLLLSMIGTGLAGTQLWALGGVVPPHRAACHEHWPATPLPQPLAPHSYQCCVNGHHSAIPSVEFRFRSLVAVVCSLDAEGEFSPNSAAFLPVRFVLPASSPPGSASLRI